ncbi:hypothetical protein E3N88_12907 [Mikania micrantha]|uniref:Uncharacterized protein n=1 Tax=Mikania micrantha TaxID=192012 RepID=A0A5N6P843_9ASTR|nr:hypothetical protein E3N88_12907 [Mikania micrantha]
MALQALQSLNLSRNQLTGRIPVKIGDLKSLSSFDVSLNRLSSEPPVTLSRLNFLSSFNVSYNNLTGRIPLGTQLQSFNEFSFFGNNLCGDPLTEICETDQAPNRDQEEDDESHGVDWDLIISPLSGFIAGFWLVLAPLMVSTRWRNTYFCFLNHLRFMFCNAIHKYSGLNIKGQSGLITHNKKEVENDDLTVTSSVGFIDERWKHGSWDLNMFVKSGKMDWDAMIVAEARRRKFLELYPEEATNQEPVLFRSSIIPWWAWITHSHLPEAELLNGRAAMIGFFMAYLVDVLTGLDVVGQSGNFICKIGLFMAVIGVVVFRQKESLKNLKNLA